nr:MAG TPA: hypothetical protein [Caudoviricetes sp.]
MNLREGASSFFREVEEVLYLIFHYMTRGVQRDAGLP